MEPILKTDPADKLLQNQSEEIYKQTRLRRYLLYTLFLPPVGLFMAFRGGVLHLVLPSYLAAESIFFGVSTVITIISLKPILQLLKVDTSMVFTGLYWMSLLAVTLIFIAAGLIVSFFYKNEVKKIGFLPGKGLSILLVILLVHYLLGALLAIYFNDRLVASFGDLNPALDNLYQTQQLLQP